MVNNNIDILANILYGIKNMIINWQNCPFLESIAPITCLSCPKNLSWAYTVNATYVDYTFWSNTLSLFIYARFFVGNY